MSNIRTDHSHENEICSNTDTNIYLPEVVILFIVIVNVLPE
jgi:hypothetical protein